MPSRFAPLYVVALALRVCEDEAAFT